MKKFTVLVKNYLELIPNVSRSVSNLMREFVIGRFQGQLQEGFSIKNKIEECLRHTVMVLMMDEFEILTWVNYLEQVNLLDLSFNVNDPYAIYMEADRTIFYMAFSTKNLLKEKKNKEPF